MPAPNMKLEILYSIIETKLILTRVQETQEFIYEIPSINTDNFVCLAAKQVVTKLVLIDIPASFEMRH